MPVSHLTTTTQQMKILLDETVLMQHWCQLEQAVGLLLRRPPHHNPVAAASNQEELHPPPIPAVVSVPHQQVPRQEVVVVVVGRIFLLSIPTPAPFRLCTMLRIFTKCRRILRSSMVLLLGRLFS